MRGGAIEYVGAGICFGAGVSVGAGVCVIARLCVWGGSNVGYRVFVHGGGLLCVGPEVCVVAIVCFGEGV